MICLDEASKQLLSDARPSLPMEPKTEVQIGELKSGQPVRQDSEYVRNGTASLFMVSAPLLGWRHVEVTDQRTCQDFARVIQRLVDEQFPDADKIVLVMDNLNTHTADSLYKAFAPAEALRLKDKLEIHFTPKHGSWLNMAEIELSVLSRQCLSERMGDKANLQKQVAAWQKKRNARAVTIDWRFTTEEARIKLKKLYPIVQP